MKIRNGFVSNSSTSSFIINSYKDKSKKLELKQFLYELLNNNVVTVSNNFIKSFEKKTITFIKNQF